MIHHYNYAFISPTARNIAYLGTGVNGSPVETVQAATEAELIRKLYDDYRFAPGPKSDVFVRSDSEYYSIDDPAYEQNNPIEYY